MTFSFKLLLAVILLPVAVFAQTNFKPGYVVTNSGDTLRGQIDYRQWDRNPREIHFKQNDEALKVYSIDNARAFALLNAAYYERYIITATNAETQLSQLSYLDTSTRVDTAFLKVLCKGKAVDFLEFTDKIKTRYYIKEATQAKPAELIYEAHLSEEDSRHIITRHAYRQQLIRLAFLVNKNDGKTIDQINRTEYTEDDLASIINKLNGVSGNTEQLTRTGGINWFVGAGISLQNVTYKGQVDLAGGISKTNLFPMVDIGLDFTSNKYVDKYFVRFEAYFTGANQIITADRLTQTIHQRTFGFSPQFFLNVYNTDAVKFFLGTGPAINYANYPQNTTTRRVGITSGNVQAYDDYPQWRGFFVNLPLHAGFTINRRLELNFCYVLSTAITNNYMDFSAIPTIYRVGINYLFK